MENNLLNLLKTCKIFSSLDDVECQKLLLKFDKVVLKKNEILFNQGDTSDYLYLLITGSLSAILVAAHNNKKVVGSIGPGETVGELGALANEPRSLTIKAVTDSVLLRLSSAVFREICNEHPAIILETINPLISRARNLIQILSEEEVKKHIVVVPAHQDVFLKLFSEKLSESLPNSADVTFLSEFSPKFYEQQTTLAELHELIETAEKANSTIIYLPASLETPLAKIAFEKADRIYIVAHSDSKPRINPAVFEKIHAQKSNLKLKHELILLHEKDTRLPTNSLDWLELSNFEMYHHIRITHEKDFQRLLRFMCGTAIGLVLGGGGIRGLAHIGVINAVIESGIPIDIIGGTSVGAIMAGYYALYGTFQNSAADFRDIIDATRKIVSFSNLTWPAISLFSSKHYTLIQKKVFGKTRIEDLWLPYFCMSSNLTNGVETVHRTGHLWKNIRASTSIPGLLPPVVINGALHLDGGLLNNLPVDIMRKFVGKKGKVIAVQLRQESKNRHPHEYRFPPILTFWQALLADMGLAYKGYKFPPAIDTFLKSLLAGSWVKEKENSLAADLLIQPPHLDQFRMLNIHREQEPLLVDIGYKAAIKAIKTKFDLDNH